MAEPPRGRTGIVYIQNPWRAHKELGMSLTPPEVFPKDKPPRHSWGSIDKMHPGRVERPKKKRRKRDK